MYSSLWTTCKVSGYTFMIAGQEKRKAWSSWVFRVRLLGRRSVGIKSARRTWISRASLPAQMA